MESNTSTGNQQLVGIADLASSNVLHTKTSIPSPLYLSGWFNQSGRIKIFPNPVLFDEVRIQFSELPPGNSWNLTIVNFDYFISGNKTK